MGETINWNLIWKHLLKEDIISANDLQDVIKEFEEVGTLKIIAQKILKGSLEEKKCFRRCLIDAGHEDVLIWLFNEDFDAKNVGQGRIPLETTSKIEEKVKANEDLIVRVKPAETYIPASEDVYKMGSDIKGRALVINNKNFSFQKERKGSDLDFKNLQDLFKGLDFEVEPYSDLTAKEMWSCLEKFSEQLQNSAVDCAVIAIGSHGSMDQKVSGIDDDVLFLEEIYSLFNNFWCPSMSQKPKIFLIQACRGDVHDEGVDVVDSKAVDTSLDSCNELKNRLPCWTDIAIIHSTVPGYISNRFVNLGSWFIRSFVKVFMEHAHNMHLVDMVRLVNKEVMKLHTFDGEKQAPELILRGWTKNLYFNPGLKEKDGN